jgi:hypothetical protein
MYLNPVPNLANEAFFAPRALSVARGDGFWDSRSCAARRRTDERVPRPGQTP